MSNDSATNPTPFELKRADGAHGYMLSSFELNSGLDVTAVAITSLSADVLREFQRLRRCWEPAAAPASQAPRP
jgi:hypothetical protein